jgi:hypothetical protein
MEQRVNQKGIATVSDTAKRRSWCLRHDNPSFGNALLDPQNLGAARRKNSGDPSLPGMGAGVEFSSPLMVTRARAASVLPRPSVR